MKTKLIGDPLKVLKPYLGSWDIPEDRDLVLTIRDVYVDEVKSQRGAEPRPIIEFEEADAKPFVLNKTNRDTITAIHGRRTASNTWAGKQIALYSAPEPKSPNGFALRVRPWVPKNAVEYCADCGLEIEPHGRYNVDKIVIMTTSKYGAALCWDCAAKRKEEAENAKVE